MKATIGKTPLGTSRPPRTLRIFPSVTLPFSHPPGTQGPSHSIAERLSASERKLLLFGWLYAFPSHSLLNTTGRRVFSLGHRSSRYVSLMPTALLLLSKCESASPRRSMSSQPSSLWLGILTYVLPVGHHPFIQT